MVKIILNKPKRAYSSKVILNLVSKKKYMIFRNGLFLRNIVEKNLATDMSPGVSIKLLLPGGIEIEFLTS